MSDSGGVGAPSWGRVSRIWSERFIGGVEVLLGADLDTPATVI